ncbi:MAG: hypothetical protein WCJ03_11830 [Bacteroidales bacterium]
MMGYEKNIELKMQRLFETLSEKDKRRYAAIEVEKLAHGGTDYISKLFGIDPKTIRRGMEELEKTEDVAKGRIRKKGAGRKVFSENAHN